MTLCTGSGSLPQHIYCQVERSFVRSNADAGTEPCVWFGLRAYPGRAWGCHVMLECGAIVRDIPLHALCTREDAAEWSLEEAQHWDCYGSQFSVLKYAYLSGLEARTKCQRYEYLGEYLFTVAPLNDAYSAEPEQAKEFMFLELRNGRFTAQPTNRVLFIERSFTNPHTEWPADIQRQSEVWACESEPDHTPEPAIEIIRGAA
jgi:hypothetical protein